MKQKSEILDAVHETAKGLHKVGLLSKKKMERYNVLCVREVQDYTPDQIKKIRQRYQISQAVLASIINISVSTVQKWEIGDKHPSGPSLKLLSIIDTQGIGILVEA
jgi:putative transcriptional regulator